MAPHTRLQTRYRCIETLRHAALRVLAFGRGTAKGAANRSLESGERRFCQESPLRWLFDRVADQGWWMDWARAAKAPKAFAPILRASDPAFAALLAASLVILAGDMWNWAWLAVLLLWVGFVSLLRPKWALTLFAAGLLANWGLARANAYKIDLTSMPITALDLKIAAANSATLWYLFNLPQWSRWALILTTVCGALALAVFALRHVKLNALPRIAIWIALLFCVLVAFDHKLARDVRSHLAASELTAGQSRDALAVWSPRKVAAVSKRIGPIAFLVYSWQLERNSGSLLFDTPRDVDGVGNTELAAAAQQLFSPLAASRPNIVLVQLESIFDPNRIFNLSQEVDNFLFKPNKFSHRLLPMRVNIVGGGSWITEFEVLTGLDYRLFGYSGYYTHATVGSYIDGGFPAYLKQKGYRTVAFYTDGKFYNARRAYRHYGFDAFLDYRDLLLTDRWNVKDTEMANAFVQRSSFFGNEVPFFAFVDTNGAHSPYRCKHFNPSHRLPVTFKGAASFRMNCELNEFLLLAQDSATAVKSILKRLREIERTTGRPFVLMVYGDHQPHSFTRTKFGVADYDGVRTPVGNSETFVHLMSSLAPNAKGLARDVPASMLPTMLSSFVSDGPDDLYMAPNTYLYEACGSDLFRSAHPIGVFGIERDAGLESTISRVQASEPLPRDPSDDAPAEACELAQKRTVARLAGASGIVKAGRLKPK
jgi:phosphoglycerol transferase MdoB-like AlkP superfamily enzyme